MVIDEFLKHFIFMHPKEDLFASIYLNICCFVSCIQWIFYFLNDSLDTSEKHANKILLFRSLLNYSKIFVINYLFRIISFAISLMMVDLLYLRISLTCGMWYVLFFQNSHFLHNIYLVIDC